MNSLTKAEIQQVIRRHERGQKKAEIVEETGLTKSTVYAILTGAGLTRAPDATRQKYAAHVERLLENGRVKAKANGKARAKPEAKATKPRKRAAAKPGSKAAAR